MFKLITLNYLRDCKSILQNRRNFGGKYDARDISRDCEADMTMLLNRISKKQCPKYIHKGD
jgi:hypothetical protein